MTWVLRCVGGHWARLSSQRCCHHPGFQMRSLRLLQTQVPGRSGPCAGGGQAAPSSSPTSRQEEHVPGPLSPSHPPPRDRVAPGAEGVQTQVRELPRLEGRQARRKRDRGRDPGGGAGWAPGVGPLLRRKGWGRRCGGLRREGLKPGGARRASARK